MGLNWAAAGWAGVSAGAAFLALETWAAGARDAIALIASVALGPGMTPAPSPALVYLAAAAVHLPLSLIYARLLAVLINGRSMGASLAYGAAFGAALYGLNFYVFSAAFPLFALARGPASLAAHFAYGLIAAGVYTKLAARYQRRRREGLEMTWK